MSQVKSPYKRLREREKLRKAIALSEKIILARVEQLSILQQLVKTLKRQIEELKP